MVTEELITLVTERYQQGEKNAQIKEELIGLGYEALDIEETFKHVQKEALRQIPLVATVNHYFEHLDNKTAQLPPHKAAAILAGCGIAVIVLAVGLYMMFDPLGTRNNERDTQRENDAVILRTALERYNRNEGHYPQKLEQLSPDYIRNVPTDPESKQGYQYKTFNGGVGFELCVTFESRNPQCISSANTNIPSIPVVVTATPVPTFSPEAASDSAEIPEEIPQEEGTAL